MSARFQFSLRTLLLVAVTIGALIGFVVTRIENSKLRTENLKYRDELGILNIDDPEKAWVREIVQDDPDNNWRFRIYVPVPGKYRIGIQGDDVMRTPINREKADYIDFEMIRGEVLLELNLKDSALSYSARFEPFERIASSGGVHGLSNFENVKNASRINLVLEKRGDFIDDHSASFDLNKPLVLVAFKKDADKTLKPQPTAKSASGLLIWFERTPK